MNSVNIVGRLTKDIELKQTSTQKSFATFTIAVDKPNKGDTKDAYFIDCVAWEKRAQVISQYFHKGNKIAISGELTSRSWNDDNGNYHKVTEVLVTGFDFCESRNDNAAPTQVRPAQNTEVPAPKNIAPDFNESEEIDLPFEF